MISKMELKIVLDSGEKAILVMSKVNLAKFKLPRWKTCGHVCEVCEEISILGNWGKTLTLTVAAPFRGLRFRTEYKEENEHQYSSISDCCVDVDAAASCYGDFSTMLNFIFELIITINASFFKFVFQMYCHSNKRNN